MSNVWKRLSGSPAFAPMLSFVSALIGGIIVLLGGFVVAQYNISAQSAADILKAQREAVLSSAFYMAKGDSPDATEAEVAVNVFAANAKLAAILPKASFKKYSEVGKSVDCESDGLSDVCVEKMAKMINITRSALSLDEVDLVDLKTFLNGGGYLDKIRRLRERQLARSALRPVPPPPQPIVMPVPPPPPPARSRPPKPQSQ